MITASTVMIFRDSFSSD